MNELAAWKDRRVLVTGIADDRSLALPIARQLAERGCRVVCSGLAPTSHHVALSDRAREHLEKAYASFQETVANAVGGDAETFPCDVSLDASLRDLAAEVAKGEPLDGVVHAIARDRTLGSAGAQPLISVSREDFMSCLDVSAYSLIALLRALLEQDALATGAGVVSLSYVGAERVVEHPYKNIAIAKAALERITVELAQELGASHGVRVNAVRFSPFAESRAGGAIPGLLESAKAADEMAALGNASPADLAREVVHLLHPGQAVTGEIRNVDGGLRILAAGRHGAR